jgi:hypothetical protein
MSRPGEDFTIFDLFLNYEITDVCVGSGSESNSYTVGKSERYLGICS